MKFLRGLSLLVPLLLASAGTTAAQTAADPYPTAKPFTRWWWFASIIDTNDVRYQLDWLKSAGFGGVEIAWVYPMRGDSAAPRLGWLSPEWTTVVAWTKKYADARGLGCDFTFGTLWPFGDSTVPPGDGTIFFGDGESKKTMRLTWEHPVRGRVINHLDRRALEQYARRIGRALLPAMAGSPSSLFCDSWEVETLKLWTAGFDRRFTGRFGYDIRPYMDSLLLPAYKGVFYDYMKMMSDYVLEEFFRPFTAITHSLGGRSRIQCGGSPSDLLTAFSIADIPETEAILYEPNFAKIPASAALYASHPVVSSETFTCLYGWKRWPGPGEHQKREQVADMKLVADALFAHGVNQIFWHGMPYNPKGGSNTFYASVHVGPDSWFREELPSFNAYMERLSRAMRRGVPASEVAVYLPLEDAWMEVEYPDSLKFPWVWGAYELRYLRTPKELKGFQPLWINRRFLETAKLRNGRLHIGGASFSSLYVDARYLDIETLRTLDKLAAKGFPICMRQVPIQPGWKSDPGYGELTGRFMARGRVTRGPAFPSVSRPFVEGEDMPDFWCRREKDSHLIFFANPAARELKYPLRYGQGLQRETVVRDVRVRAGEKMIPVRLEFPPYQSLLLRVRKDGTYAFEDISFIPSTPVAE